MKSLVEWEVDLKPGLIRTAVYLFGLTLTLSAGPSQACTSFMIRDDQGSAFGWNMDWSVGEALVMLNPCDRRRQLWGGPGRTAQKFIMLC